MNSKTKKIVEDIKTLKIQGAENVANSSLEAISSILKYKKTKDYEEFIHDLYEAKKILFNTRPTEPCLRNTLNFVFKGIHKARDIHDLKDMLEAKIITANHHFNTVKKNIPKFGEKKIFKNSTIFTHCHSSTVTSILKRAKDNKKKFIVHNTETRPKFQGRLTAIELNEHNIPVVHYVDSAARLALKKADLMLIGADAITSEGKIINKIGSELFTEIANKYQIPVYCCTDSWKFDPLSIFGYEEEIEERSYKEVWKNKPKGVKICNYAFEKISPDLITGIISEIGIYKPEIFIEEIRRNYSWMFD